jgi:glycerophosphoryl diester phosphodiesterase
MAVLDRPTGRPLRIGHRGAPALAEENTITSFRAAVAAGVDLVEFDISTLPDGTIVVAHSGNVAEITKGALRSPRHAPTLEELRQHAPGLATLDEVLAFFGGEAPGVGLQLDLKAVDAAAVAGRVVGHGLVSRTVVSSTSVRMLRAVSSAAPGIATGLTYPHDRLGISTRRGMEPVVAIGLQAMRARAVVRLPRLAAAAGGDAVFLHHRIVTPAVVRRLHAGGLSVLAWTVDAVEDIVRVVGAGVDGVISNDPAMLLATLEP